MKKTLHKYFIPHSGNNYHPHILHAKRAWFYGALGVLIKGLVVVFVMLLPAEAFVMPNIVAVEESKIVMLTNSLRLKSGLPKLSESPKLAASALYKAEDMADKQYFAHESPEGNRLTFFLDRAGYKYQSAGENLAIGYFDATKVLEAWKASPTHKANLLDKDFTQIGVGAKDGAYEGTATLYVAQHFGKPRELVATSKPTVAVVKTTPAATATAQMTASEPIQETTTVPVATVAAEKINELPAVKNSTINGLSDSNFTLLYKYRAAHRVLGDTMPVFGYSSMVYICLITLFTLALLFNVFIEIKVQHKHVIVHTLALLGVLVGLWLI